MDTLTLTRHPGTRLVDEALAAELRERFRKAGAYLPAHGQRSHECFRKGSEFGAYAGAGGSALPPGLLASLRRVAVELHGIEDAYAASPEFESRTLLFTASTESVDRYGDRILVDGTFPLGGELRQFGAGWQTDDYTRLTPVFLCGHNYSAELPIGTALQTWRDVSPDGRKRLRQAVLFARAETNPLAERLLNAYKERVIRWCSVGFWPRYMYKPATDEERAELGLGPYGYLFGESVLWENSAVVVPANPEAVQERGIGLDVPALRRLGDELKEHDARLGEEVRDALETLNPARKTVDLGAAPIERSGRVLSKANEMRLRNAAAAIQSVLDTLPTEEEDDDAEDAAESASAQPASQQVGLNAAALTELARSFGVQLDTDPRESATVDALELASALKRIDAKLDKLAGQVGSQTTRNGAPSGASADPHQHLLTLAQDVLRRFGREQGA